MANLVSEVIDGSLSVAGSIKFPSTAGFAYTLTGVAPAQATAVSFIDPGVATCHLVLDNTGGAVTQGTNINTAVTLNKRAGIITMAATIGPGLSGAFTFNNSYITATSQVLVWSQNTVSGTSFLPVILASSAIAAGSCTITVTNTDATHATSAAPIVQFIVI